MKTKIFAILLVTIVVGFIVYRYFFFKEDKYTLGKAERREVVEMVTESGVVVSSGKVNIYSPTNGIVDKLYVFNGASVSAKSKLFSVKSTATQQEKAEAYAVYQAAKTALAQAENNRRATIATVDRVHDDVKGNDDDETFLQKETRTTAEVANDNAYSELISAQANLASAQAKYYATQNTTVTSPISGVVTNLSTTEGGSVLINTVTSPVTPVLIVKGDGMTEILISVGETDINKINIGQEAEIKFDAIENKTYKGRVTRYDNHGTHVLGVAKFNVYLSITDPDEKIKSGMNSDVSIITRKVENVITVPNTSIKPYQKGRAVRVVGKNGEIEFVNVKVGIKGKEYSEIIEGLTEGQEIVLTLKSEEKPKSSFFNL